MNTGALEPRWDAEVTIDLAGPDGNAFMVMGLVKRAMVEAGATAADTAAYFSEATSGDYEHLLEVSRRTVRLVEWS
jgi:hypothetical protein